MANFFCKVLSKIMVERLSCLLPRLVSNEQGVFQKGKIISSNIGLASELANLLHTSVRGGGMGIKIDVQKAYDTFSWDFLFAVLKRFGFSDVWFAWIHEILVSSRILVLLNGGPVGFFGVEKEEVLCRGLNGLLKEGKLKALPGPRGATAPSHLIFADDIFIFMNAGERHVQCLREFLLKYQEFSGQRFSLEKSKGWQGKLLSMAGHAELIRFVILGMPIHNFSIYWWPESVIKTVERWIRNFLWSGDIYTVKKITMKWEEVCRPKEEGGLGIRQLRDVNCAVLSKLVWQIKHEGSAFSSFLWARFVNEGGDLKKGYRASSVFKGIAKMWNFVSLSERWMEDDFSAHVSWWTQKSKAIGLSQMWMAGLIIVPYFIWMERNSRRFRGLHRSYGQVFHTIMEEIRRRGPGKSDRIKSRLDSERCLKLNMEVPRRKIKGVREIFWLPPMDGWWKLNCDGSSLGNPGNAGAGGIIKGQ
ncbi:uncharacterized protein LOC122072657 [Macadamia integrifolia]|uniref:uncharacterized protein LOC122072657 n=1 Tax=Macadamia integrifolia TaxID=60698 RepID=UPI001C4EE7D9|nr:uncharacterized protein LOC122072657 [Macadamia integrifolia]